MAGGASGREIDKPDASRERTRALSLAGRARSGRIAVRRVAPAHSRARPARTRVGLREERLEPEKPGNAKRQTRTPGGHRGALGFLRALLQSPLARSERASQWRGRRR